MRVLIAIFCAAIALPLLAEEVQIHSPPRTISTNGEAIIYVAPDEVIVNFGVETSDASVTDDAPSVDAATTDDACTSWARPTGTCTHPGTCCVSSTCVMGICR